MVAQTESHCIENVTYACFSLLRRTPGANRKKSPAAKATSVSLASGNAFCTLAGRVQCIL